MTVDDAGPPCTLVLDIGKTNLKLAVVDGRGRIVAQRALANAVLPGPPWAHPDLEGIERWLRAGIEELAGERAVGTFVATGHGSGGVLVDDRGPVLPSIDYEDEPPASVVEAHRRLAPPFPERGSGMLGGASHFARQLLWVEEAFPDALARATRFLALPQYWAWRLGGRPVGEPTMLGAQSHLWSPLSGAFTGLVDARGWRRLLEPVVPAWTDVGEGPRGMRLLAGVHDSSANFYRYERAGTGPLTLLSTGTWIVGMTARIDEARLDEARNVTLTTAVDGRPTQGLLAMTGREWATLAGDGRAAERADVRAVLDAGTAVLPGFCDFDGIHPGTAGRGGIIGEAPSGAAGRAALATLYAALVAEEALELLGAEGRVVIDGGFTANPLFAAILAALRPDLEILVEPHGGGTAVGAALLASHERGAAPDLALRPVDALDLDGLDAYRARWRERVAAHVRPRP